MNISGPMRPYVPPYLRSPGLGVPGPSTYARQRTPSPGPSIQSTPSHMTAYDGFENVSLGDIEMQDMSRAEQKRPMWSLRTGFATPPPGPIPGLVQLAPPPPMHEVEEAPSRCHRAMTLGLAITCMLTMIALPVGVVYAAVRGASRGH